MKLAKCSAAAWCFHGTTIIYLALTRSYLLQLVACPARMITVLRMPKAHYALGAR